MYQELARKAIAAALAQDWDSATEINSRILSANPHDLDALNRISQAYLRKGLLKEAIKSANKVFEIDPLNPIAAKCLSKCDAIKDKSLNTDFERIELSKLQNLFIEEPGVTKIVSLINVCEISTLASLDPGQQVNMIPRQRRVVVTTISEDYIGRLPDDLAARIISFVNEGREYSSHIKSIASKGVKIFIRDTSADKLNSSIKSFKV